VEVIADAHARDFGAALGERTLVPAYDARLGETHLEDWLDRAVERPLSPPSPSVASHPVAPLPAASP
jgi:hypothetical protein